MMKLKMMCDKVFFDVFAVFNEQKCWQIDFSLCKRTLALMFACIILYSIRCSFMHEWIYVYSSVTAHTLLCCSARYSNLWSNIHIVKSYTTVFVYQFQIKKKLMMVLTSDYFFIHSTALKSTKIYIFFSIQEVSRLLFFSGKTYICIV